MFHITLFDLLTSKFMAFLLNTNLWYFHCTFYGTI